jgi:hypothetical protein
MLRELSFATENLIIDYISFNIQGYLQSAYIQKIAFYLFESFGFNSSVVQDDSIQELKEKTIFF